MASKFWESIISGLLQGGTYYAQNIIPYNQQKEALEYRKEQDALRQENLDRAYNLRERAQNSFELQFSKNFGLSERKFDEGIAQFDLGLGLREDQFNASEKQRILDNIYRDKIFNRRVLEKGKTNQPEDTTPKLSKGASNFLNEYYKYAREFSGEVSLMDKAMNESGEPIPKPTLLSFNDWVREKSGLIGTAFGQRWLNEINEWQAENYNQPQPLLNGLGSDQPSLNRAPSRSGKSFTEYLNGQ